MKKAAKWCVGLIAACVGAAAVSCTQGPRQGGGAGGDAEAKANIAWDWTGIVGTGQSLAVGQNGTPVVSMTQPYGNLKLDSGTLPWPVDANAEQFKLVPLVEPIGRRGTGGWPANIAGETPHAGMGNEITALVQGQFHRDLVSVHVEVGENGQGMRRIKKNPPDPQGRAYEATLVQAKALARLAKAAGKTFGIGAITVTHGETDSGSATYERELRQMWEDYNTDLKAITGQSQKILMIVSQQHGSGNPSVSTQTQWKIGVDYPEDIVCSGPKYQYASRDGLHCTADGYRQLGEKYGEVYYERVILGHDWRPLEPTKILHAGKTLTIEFHVPAGPLAWDTEMDAPHASVAEWKAGKGFEVATAGNQRVTIESAEINANSVVLTCAADPGEKARVSYAMTGERRRAQPSPGFQRWGLLKDSDGLKGVGSGKELPNYAVAFQMTGP